MTKNISRRHFLGTTAASVAGVALLPQLVGCSGSGSGKAGDTIRMGFIGAGQQTMNLLRGFIQFPEVEVVAGCDVYGIKRQRFEQRVNDYYAKQQKNIKVDMYENYRDVLARTDINTVVIAVPDHWHAFIAIEACKAGKNIYLEKPMTFTIKEGQELVKAVRQNDVILAVGSQQRSSPEFQHAVKMVHEGRIGNIERIYARVGAPPKPYDLPEMPVPGDLNWEMWLGPSEFIHYHSDLNPVISLDPPENEKFWAGWRWYKEVGGGFTTDWGAHMFDIAQWALKMDNSGPVEIIPAGYKDTQYLTYKYANGTVMTEQPFNETGGNGIKFWGDKGWIEVARDFYEASDKSLYPAEEEEAGENVPYETKAPHYADFLDAIRNHKNPVVPVEVGHRTCTVCTLGNIAYELMRPLKWDPEKEQFVNDPEAEKKLTKTYREGYSI